MTATRFADSTSIDPLDDGRFAARLDPGWCTGEAPNGGYLLAILARAMQRSVPLKHPLTVTATFLRATRPGEADVAVGVIRLGGTLNHVEAHLSQDGKESVRAIGIFGRPNEGPTRFREPRPPVLPDPDECRHVPVPMPNGAPSHVRNRFDIRYATGLGWLDGTPSGRPEVRAWVHLDPDEEPDSLLSLLLLDLLPSTAFELGYPGWTPTISYTTSVRAVAGPGWLRCVSHARLVTADLVEEDSELWDESDRLIATSRQLALLPLWHTSTPTAQTENRLSPSGADVTDRPSR